MFFYVTTKVGSITKGRVTFPTGKWLLSSMSSSMGLQVIGLVKGKTTNITLKGPLICVNALMNTKIAGIPKGLVAFRTSESQSN